MTDATGPAVHLSADLSADSTADSSEDDAEFAKLFRRFLTGVVNRASVTPAALIWLSRFRGPTEMPGGGCLPCMRNVPRSAPWLSSRPPIARRR